MGGAPTTALVGGSTAGSPQPSPISTGKLFKCTKGHVGLDGVQPRGTEAAVLGAGPGSGGPPFRLCTTADRPGEEVAAAGDTLGGRHHRADGPGAVSEGAAHGLVLVLVDYATRYPEAVPLRNISAKSVAQALFQMISCVGIPKEILTDQGTSFMSRTLQELYELLGIQSIKTGMYHPQMDGLVDHFNRTLKSMTRKFVHDDSHNLG